jgi:hypothetical protein
MVTASGAAMLLTVSHAATPEPAPDAHSIMDSVLRQDTSRDITIQAAFEIFDQAGHRSVKKFTYRRIVGADGSRILVMFSDPEAIRGVALLSVRTSGKEPLQYLYTPATGRVRTVAQQQRNGRFLDTDLTFEDIGEHQLNDFDYRLLSSTEVIDGRRSYKIVATPRLPENSQYKYLYYWVAHDAPVILAAEMYDDQDRKIRAQHATGFRRVSGIWGARVTETRSVVEGTRTTLVVNDVAVNTGLREQLFTPEALETAAPVPTKP